MNAQRTFVSHAAHELRSPLATLRGELQLALRRERSAAEYRAAVEQALADVEELRQLAEDLLTLARVQKAGRPHNGGTVDVRTIVVDAVHMARGHADSHHVAVLAPGTDDGVLSIPVRGVARDLARALRNLLDNAVSHSPEGGTVHLSVAVTTGGRAIDIAVEDEGPGVDEADLDRIFTPFWRGSNEESGAPGAGLGLAIAREIARGHEGDIVVDKPASGRGARFVLRVPRALGKSLEGSEGARDQLATAS
jgi:two-component system heavy metal sensor histidine kinase CusS